MKRNIIKKVIITNNIELHEQYLRKEPNIMQCPYCKDEVEWGNLETEGSPGLFYIPDNVKKMKVYTAGKVDQNGGIVLDGPYLTRLNRTKVQCCICRKCKKIIIPYH